MQTVKRVPQIVAMLLLLSPGVLLSAECEFSIEARSDHYGRSGETMSEGIFGVGCYQDGDRYGITADIQIKGGNAVGRTLLTTDGRLGAVTVRELSARFDWTESLSLTAGVIRPSEMISFDTNPWIDPRVRRNFSYGPIEAAIDSENIGSPGVMLQYNINEQFGITGYGLYTNQQVYPAEGPWSLGDLTGFPVHDRIEGSDPLVGVIAQGSNNALEWSIGVAYGSTGTITSLNYDQPEFAPVTKDVAITHGALSYEFENDVIVRAGVRYDNDGIIQTTVEVGKLFTLSKGDLYFQGGVGYSQGCDDATTMDLRCFYRELTGTVHVVFAINNWELGFTGLAARDSSGAANVNISYRFENVGAKMDIVISATAEGFFGDPKTNFGGFGEYNKYGIRFRALF